MDQEAILQSETILKKRRTYKANLQSVKRQGYNTLTEFIIDKYYLDFLPARIIAQLISENTTNFMWILNHINKIGLICRPAGVTKKEVLYTDDWNVRDKKLNIRDKKEILTVAKTYGYQYVSEALIDMFFHKSFTFSEISKRFNKTTCWSIRIIEKMNHGGKRYVKLTDELKIKILKDLKTIEPKWNDIQQYLNNENIQISPKTVQRLIKESTLYKNNPTGIKCNEI